MKFVHNNCDLVLGTRTRLRNRLVWLARYLEASGIIDDTKPGRQRPTLEDSRMVHSVEHSIGGV